MPAGPIESFDQLLVSQAKWIRDLVEFVKFAPDRSKHGKIDTTIDDVLAARDEEGYLVAASDG